MADTVAELMVKIGGDASGLDNALKGVKGSVDGLASGMKTIGVGLTAAVTVPLVAIGAAAMKASSDVNGAYREIQRQTGATGTELAKLKEDFRDVFSTVPASAADVATALSMISQAVDVTQQDTVDLATEFLNLSRITGTDLTTNIKQSTESFNAWGLAGEQMQSNLDGLYVIFQNTGVAVSDLSDITARAAGPAQAAGLSYQETAILVGQLGAAGVPTKQVISTLNAVIKDSTTNNRSASVEWQSLVDKFKDPAYKATADDMKLLGNNTATFAAAAKRGDLDFAPLLAKIKESPNAINEMATKTGTLSDSLTLLKNRLTLALEPLGTAIFGVTKDIVKDVTPAMDIIENLGKAFDKLPAPVKQATVVLGALAASSGPVITAGGSIMSMLTPLLLNLGTLSPLLMAVGIPMAAVGVTLGVLAVGLGIAYTASATFRGVLGTLTTAFTTFGGSVMKAITQLTSGDFSGALDTLRTALNQLVVDLSTIDWSSVGDKIRTEIANAFSNQSSTLNIIADQLTKMINAVPWHDLGLELGQFLGEMLSVGFGAISGTGGGQSTNNDLGALMGTSVGTAGSSGGAGGFEGFKAAGKTGAGAFVAGFEQGLKDGMANIDWGAVVAAIWDGLYAAGPQVMGKDKTLFSLLGMEDPTKSGDTAIQDAIGRWWDGIVWPELKLPEIKIPSWSEAIKGGPLENLPDFGKMVSDWWNNISWPTLSAPNIKIPSWEEAIKGGPLEGAVLPDFGKMVSDWWNNIKWPTLSAPSIKIPSWSEILKGGPLENFTFPDVGKTLSDWWNNIPWPALALPVLVLPAIGTVISNWWNGIVWPDVGGALGTWWNGIAWPSLGIPSVSLPDIAGIITTWWNGIAFPDIGGSLSTWWNGISWPSFGTPSITWPDIIGAINAWWNGLVFPDVGKTVSDWWNSITWPELKLPDLKLPSLDDIFGGGNKTPDTPAASSDVTVKVTADTSAVQNAINNLTGKDVIINVWDNNTAQNVANVINGIQGKSITINVWDNNTAQNVVNVVNSIQGKDVIINVWDNNTAQNVVNVVNSIQGKDVIINVWDNNTASNVVNVINGIQGKDVIINVWDNGTCASVQATINAIQGKTVEIIINAQDNASGVVNSIQGKTVYVDVVSRTSTQPAAEGMVVGMASGGHVTAGPQLALIGEAGPEAVIPQKYWGGVAPWVLNSLPKYAGGVSTGGGGGGDNTWDKSLKQTADYAVNLKPINDTAARSLNYAIVTTQNAVAANQNTGVANQHLNNITAVGQATTAACITTADACAATTAACSDNCTTATDGNTAAIAGSCSSMASSCAATAGSCAATAGSCAATAGSCGTTAGCLTSNCASYASGGYVDKPQFAFIGEREHEYIIPESKMGGGRDRRDMGRYDKHDRHQGNTYNIHVEGVKAEEIARDIARQQRIRDIMML